MANYRGSPRNRDMDGTPPARKGRQLSSRDYRRMSDFNERKVQDTGTTSWAELSEPLSRYYESEPKWRDGNRANQQRRGSSQGRRGPQKPPQNPRYLQRGETSSKPVDEDLYSGDVLGATPARKTLCQNFEYAGLSSVMQATYDQTRALEPRLDQMCPFPVFQHAVVELVTARI